MRIDILNRALAYAVKKANGKRRSDGCPYPGPFDNPPPPKEENVYCDCPEVEDVHPNLIATVSVHPESGDYFPPVKIDKDNDSELERLRKENTFMLKLLVDIERAIDHGDQQQIAVAIKRLRDVMPTDHFMTGNIKPGLERE